MKFQGFTLDPFQEEAIGYVDKNFSVVVSAATGTGKTLIADYVVSHHIKKGHKIVYTAPIKALSNQKFYDFSKTYGEDAVGIMTGDVVINPTAPLLIMTTEIYRNMLLQNDPFIDELSYVIFDEIHYINDRERGTVWEESIIFSPEHIRFLCLSATIPNAEEFAAWIASIKNHEVKVVRYEKRAVPLRHFVFDAELGITTTQKLLGIMQSERSFRYHRGGRKSTDRPREGHHTMLIEDIQDKLPAIFFVFSRKHCEEKAEELARKKHFLTNDQKVEVTTIVNRYITDSIRTLQTTAKLRNVLSHGIAFHHAGILPPLKKAVEEMFAKGLIKVLYATETFSVGINMPAKSVCFASLVKYDGVSMRPVNAKEYFQLAGRAGRRGIDTEGFVYVTVRRNKAELEHLAEISVRDDIPLQSQFRLAYNTVLNLLGNHNAAEIETILRSNFDYYLRKQSEKQVRIMASFNNKKRVLQKYGYVDKNQELTKKGNFTRHIYAYELEISELITGGIYKKLSNIEILCTLAALVYEPSPSDKFIVRGGKQIYEKLRKQLATPFLQKQINFMSLKRMIPLVQQWATGCSFKDLLEVSNLAEGDIIRLMRRMIDVMRQIMHASTDEQAQLCMHECIELIDRDVVSIVL
ncbi:MAG: DEAD/DEAH box helicase [Candidatus Woesearchaeota archaeon]|nr:MAG: DEAD/DEAH box helicase [Candidatus Woesearchaeota archaeon]